MGTSDEERPPDTIVNNVIEFRKRFRLEELPLYERHWKARAAIDPEWAGRQISGLLERALRAESCVRQLIAEQALERLAGIEEEED